MIRLPPSSTLFPSPTLFRSKGSQTAVAPASPAWLAEPTSIPTTAWAACFSLPFGPASNPSGAPRLPAGKEKRSEEHTSELQSHLNLVCRLLLEKKKN